MYQKKSQTPNSPRRHNQDFFNIPEHYIPENLKKSRSPSPNYARPTKSSSKRSNGTANSSYKDLAVKRANNRSPMPQNITEEKVRKNKGNLSAKMNNDLPSEITRRSHNHYGTSGDSEGEPSAEETALHYLEEQNYAENSGITKYLVNANDDARSRRTKNSELLFGNNAQSSREFRPLISSFIERPNNQAGNIPSQSKAKSPDRSVFKDPKFGGRFEEFMNKLLKEKEQFYRQLDLQSKSLAINTLQNPQRGEDGHDGNRVFHADEGTRGGKIYHNNRENNAPTLDLQRIVDKQKEFYQKIGEDSDLRNRSPNKINQSLLSQNETRRTNSYMYYNAGNISPAGPRDEIYMTNGRSPRDEQDISNNIGITQNRGELELELIKSKKESILLRTKYNEKCQEADDLTLKLYDALRSNEVYKQEKEDISKKYKSLEDEYLKEKKRYQHEIEKSLARSVISRFSSKSGEAASNLEAVQAIHHEHISVLEKRIQELETDLTAYETKNRELRDKLNEQVLSSKNNEDIKPADYEEKLKSILKENSDEVERVKSEKKKLSDSLADLQKRSQEKEFILSHEIDELKIKYENLIKEHSELKIQASRAPVVSEIKMDQSLITLELDNTKAELQSVKNSYREKTLEYENLKAQIGSKSSEDQEALLRIKTLETKYEGQLSQNKREIDALKSENDQLKTKIQALSVTSAISKSGISQEDFDKMRIQKDEEIVQLKSQIESLKKENDELKQKITEFGAQIVELQSKVKDYSALQESLAQIKVLEQNSKKSLEDLQAKLEEAEMESATLKVQLADLSNKVPQYEAEIKSFKASKVEMERTIKAQDEMLGGMDDKFAQMSTQIVELTMRESDLMAQIKKLSKK